MIEISDEWMLGNRVPILSDIKSFQMQLKDGQIREVHRKLTVDSINLWFADCTHPAQNAYCNDESIAYWRVKK